MIDDLSFDISTWLMEFEKEEFLNNTYQSLFGATTYYSEEIYD